MSKQEKIESVIENRYADEFMILKEYGGLVDGWSNVYNHCKTECAIALVMSGLLKLDEKNTNILAKAAILHDWYKRKEKESEETGPDKYVKGALNSYFELLKLGVDETVVQIAHCVGHTSLRHVTNTTKILQRIMHFIDDITLGDKVVELDIRIDYLEKNEDYREMNEKGRAEHSGKTYFEVQRELGHQIQNEIEQLIIKKGTIICQGELVSEIRKGIIRYLF